MKVLLIAVFISIMATPGASAAIYHCMQNGKAIYSDRPCSTDSKTLQVTKSVDTQPEQVATPEDSAMQDQQRAITNLRFRYEIADNDVRNKQRDIAAMTNRTEEMEKQHQEKIAELNNDLSRIYRKTNYGKYRAQQIENRIEAENNAYLNTMTITRNKLNLLYDDLRRAKEKKAELQKLIEARSP